MYTSTSFRGQLVLEHGQLAYPLGYFWNGPYLDDDFKVNTPFNQIIWFSKDIGTRYKLDTLVSVPPCRARKIPCGTYINDALVDKLIMQLTINFHDRHNKGAKDKSRRVFFGNDGLRAFERHVDKKLSNLVDNVVDIGTLDFTELEKELTKDFENFVNDQANLGNLFITPKPKFSLWTYLGSLFK